LLGVWLVTQVTVEGKSSNPPATSLQLHQSWAIGDGAMQHPRRRPDMTIRGGSCPRSRKRSASTVFKTGTIGIEPSSRHQLQIAKDVGAWLKATDEAVYGSRPFEVFGEGEVRYTRNRGNVYATMLNWNGGPVTLKSLRSGGATLGKVSKVELLGSEVPLTFIQDEQGLTVTDGGAVQPLPGITNQSLASGCRVLRITHDKSWINDDDLDGTAPGWIRRCNLETGDYNNDLVISETPGDVWSCSFTGRSVTVIAPKEARAGKIEMQIDGKTRAMADLSITGTRLAQQRVCSVTGLNHCQHSLAIVNRGPGPVAVDAIVVR